MPSSHPGNPDAQCVIRWLILAAAVLLGPLTAQDRPPHRFDLQRLAGDVVLEKDHPLGAPALELRAGGAALKLPGARQAPWADARYLVGDVLQQGRQSGTLRIEFFTRGGDRPRIHAKIGFLPGLRTQFVLPLQHLDGQTFFLARQPRQLKGVMPGSRLPAEKITAVSIVAPPGNEGSASLWLANLRLTTSRPEPLPPRAEPIVDPLGQWRVRDWPGKTSSAEQLVADLRELHEEVTGEVPDAGGRSPYGGLLPKQFEASGFFRVEREGKRWWLVDPDGCAFFSIGVDCLGPSSHGPVTDMEDLFAWLPQSNAFGAAVSERQGQRQVSMLTVNLIRAFGDEWRGRWEELTAGLLRRWRFNTIGNWSDRGFAERARMPWVLPLGGFPTTKVKLYRDFPDVFAEEYAQASKSFARQMTRYRDDRYLIGYFLRNEPPWAFGENNLAAEMLATEQQSATRRALVEWLKQRYRGDVKVLGEAWGLELESYAELVRRAFPDLADRSARAREDLWEFSERMVEAYLERPSVALRDVAPHHLNLGIRYAWVSSELCYAGAEHFDVFSINAYVEKPNREQIAEITAKSGKPVLIGEFHHGAVDRGLPSTGIRGVATQKDRGAAYRYYVEQGAAIPSLVGVHYFQWNDQPLLGRFDGENYNIGFVDVCNRPYGEFVEAVRATNERIYEVAAGKVAPVAEKPPAIRAVYF